MDGSALEVKKMRVTSEARGYLLHLTLPDGRTLAPIPVDSGFAKHFACAAIRATPMEKV